MRDHYRSDDTTSKKIGAFGALFDTTQFITFSGTTGLEFSWDIAESRGHRSNFYRRGSPGDFHTGGSADVLLQLHDGAHDGADHGHDESYGYGGADAHGDLRPIARHGGALLRADNRHVRPDGRADGAMNILVHPLNARSPSPHSAV